MYAGAPTAKLMELTSQFGPASSHLSASRFLPYRDRDEFRIKDFLITPFCMDHSAFDAHALLIKAGDKTLFYMGKKDIRDRFRPFWMPREKIAADPSKVILMVRPTMRDDLIRLNCLAGGTLVYSLWGGYKTIDPRVADFIAMLAKKGVQCEDAHTSGHAPVPILQKLVKKLNPGVIIPVHTELPGNYPQYFKNVHLGLKDGQELDL